MLSLSIIYLLAIYYCTRQTAPADSAQGTRFVPNNSFKLQSINLAKVSVQFFLKPMSWHLQFDEGNHSTLLLFLEKIVHVARHLF